MLAAQGDTVELGCGIYSLYNSPAAVVAADLVIRSETGASDCARVNGWGSRHLRVSPGAALTLEGIEFISGGASSGGSLAADGQNTLTVRDCYFRLNGARFGGAIHAGPSCDVRLESCTFRGNWAGGGPRTTYYQGAAIYVSSGTTLVADGCEFVANHGESGPPFGPDTAGGGVYALESPEVRLTGCLFRENAVQAGGAVFAKSSRVLVEDSLFQLNEASGGYSFAGLGGAIQLEADLGSRVASSVFESNVARDGGALSIQGGGPVEVVDCIITSNSARSGGGVRCASATAFIAYTVIAGNQSTLSTGGGAHALSSQVTFDHVTLYGNGAATLGSGVYSSNSEVHVLNSIVASGVGGPAIACAAETATPTVMCMDIFGNAGGDWTDCVAGLGSTQSNFSLDPLFCDAAADVFTLGRFSPCAPPGLHGCGQVGALGVGCGPVSVEPMTWGRLKALYR